MTRPERPESPLAPIGHHWMDATHISYGVLTGGFVAAETVKLEASAFNGREPDHERWNVEEIALDSYAVRVTVNPASNWSIQLSYADLREPERLHPGIDAERWTASATYNRALASGNWQTTVAWGRNRRDRTDATIDLPGVLTHAHLHLGPLDALEPALSQSAVLAESAVQFSPKGSVFGRFEWVEKDELFDPSDFRHSLAFDISKFSVGLAHELFAAGSFEVLAGVNVGIHLAPRALSLDYGKVPIGTAFFLRLKIR